MSHVHINNIFINSTVELWFKNNQNLTFNGELNCNECKNRTLNFTNAEHHQRPQVNLRIIDNENAKFDNFMQDSSVDFTLKTRNLQTFQTQDSYFTHFSKSSMELFNVKNVTLYHSEFHGCSEKFLVVNSGVRHVNIKDCLMDDNALEK